MNGYVLVLLPAARN